MLCSNIFRSAFSIRSGSDYIYQHYRRSREYAHLRSQCPHLMQKTYHDLTSQSSEPTLHLNHLHSMRCRFCSGSIPFNKASNQLLTMSFSPSRPTVQTRERRENNLATTIPKRSHGFVSKYNNTFNLSPHKIAAYIVKHLPHCSLPSSLGGPPSPHGDVDFRITSDHVIMKECPFCRKPTKGKGDNHFKLYIKIGSGTYFCHRCGSKGSWFDFKREIGGFSMDNINFSSGSSNKTISSNVGLSTAESTETYNGNDFSFRDTNYNYSPKQKIECLPMPSKKIASVHSFNLFDSSKNLMDKTIGNTALDYLTKQRGFSKSVLKKYGVGCASYNFPSKDAGHSYVSSMCVTFPWLMRESEIAELESLRGVDYVWKTDSEDVNPKANQKNIFENEKQRKKEATRMIEKKLNASAFERHLMRQKRKSEVKAKIPSSTCKEDEVENLESILGPYIPRRIKVRSIENKSWQRLDPSGGGFGLFGWHTIPHDANEIIITEGEFDAMAVYQATGRPAVSLPNGCRSLPMEVLVLLEKFDTVYLWMDNDGPGREGAEMFAKKIGVERCLLVQPSGKRGVPNLGKKYVDEEKSVDTFLPSSSIGSEPFQKLDNVPSESSIDSFSPHKDYEVQHDIAVSSSATESLSLSDSSDLQHNVSESTKLIGSISPTEDKLQHTVSESSSSSTGCNISCPKTNEMEPDIYGFSNSFLPTAPPKDANEALLMGWDINELLLEARVLPHDKILKFTDLRDQVVHEILNPEKYQGTQIPSLPGFTSLIKGFRRGEMTVLTGPTGSGKTTFLGQTSLDLAEQGINVLWGSFEIKNTRLIHKLLQQFTKEYLPYGIGQKIPSEDEQQHAITALSAIADRFESLPMYFLKFHGGSDIDDVLDAMEYAAYVYDVEHVILDNMQFMISRQSSGGKTSTFDKFDMQDIAIEKFRKFATNYNVHVTLVVHPRKEVEGTALGMSSFYGSAKATQEADTVLILQDVGSKKSLEVKKNRFDGTIGHVPIYFERKSGRYSENPAVANPSQIRNSDGVPAINGLKNRSNSTISTSIYGNIRGQHPG